MPVVALNAEFLLRLHSDRPSAGAISYFDKETRGFLLEHRPSGGATFYFRYRDSSGKIRLNRLGRLGDISLADARAQAHQMRKIVAEGGDPKIEKNRFREVPTLGAFILDRYLPYAKQRKRSWSTDLSNLRNHILPALADFRMDRISRADVIALHHHMLKKGYAAGTCNQILILLKSIYNCAIRWEFLPEKANPCGGVLLFEDNGARERYLTQEEVGRLFAELDRNRNTQVGHVIRLLLYTGARKREILDAKWEEIDLNRKLLTVPAARSKSKKPRHIPLSEPALELLRSLPREEGVPWVFFSSKTKKPPVSMFNSWNSIRRKVGLAEVRLHDLRHSYASFLVNAGRSLYEVQKLLGHYDPKVTMRYAHLSSDAMLEAANVVGRVVTMEMSRNQAKAEEKHVRAALSVAEGASSDISGLSTEK